MNIVEFLKEHKLTISAAESFTGGAFSSAITDISGSSEVFKGSIVSYGTDVKEKVLKVNGDIINQVGTVSKECAIDMAVKAKQMFKSDIAVSFTGNAGPTASENKEVGLVYICIYYNNEIDCEELHLQGSRKDIKKFSVKYAISKILKII